MPAEQLSHNGRAECGRGDCATGLVSRGALHANIARSASGATVSTIDGCEIVDFASGSFGYSHPEIVAAVAEQLEAMPLSARLFLSRPLARFVERLAEVSPGNLAVTYPCNSSTEAMEGALKLARGLHRSRRRIIAIAGSRHGTTLGALSVSEGVPDHVAHRLPIPARFIPFGDIAALRRALHDERTSAVVMEPWSCGAGLRLPAPGYLTAVRRLCDEHGALLIVNETNTGLGRTGQLFAVNSENVVPDILVVGGALGGGVMPVGAYVTTREINRRVYGRSGPWMHGSTTGGNPLACTAARVALDVIESEDIVGSCRSNGANLMLALGSMQTTHPSLVSDVRGDGYLAELGLCGPETALAVARRALAHGVLTRVGAEPGRASIGIRPPLIATTKELERGLECIARALDDVAAKRAA